jgi:hypothetical protein
LKARAKTTSSTYEKYQNQSFISIMAIKRWKLVAEHCFLRLAVHDALSKLFSD